MKEQLAGFDSRVGETSDAGSANRVPGILTSDAVWTAPLMGVGRSPAEQQAYLSALETLADEQIKEVSKLDQAFMETSLILLDKVRQGFMEMGDRTRQFVKEMTVMAVQFFRDAQTFKAKLASPDAQVFHEGLEQIRQKVVNLMEEADNMTETYEMSKLGFNKILQRTMKTVCRYLNMAVNYNCSVYKSNVFGLLAKHSNVVGMGAFVPVIVQTTSTHMTLLTSQHMNQSVVPLNITMVPLMLDAEAVKWCMSFVKFLTQWSLNAKEKVGPQLPPTPSAPPLVPKNVNLESDNNSVADWGGMPG